MLAPEPRGGHAATGVSRLLGGAAAAWPIAARTQQAERMRRISVLLPAAADDPEMQVRLAAFHQELALLGWTIGRNVRIDTRWATANAAEIRRHAAELAVLMPDVILAYGASAVGPLLQATRAVPIVFPVIADPVGAGFVESLARVHAGLAAGDSAAHGVAPICATSLIVRLFGVVAGLSRGENASRLSQCANAYR